MLRAVVLGGAVALLVVGALMPSESTISNGTYAPLAAGWCLLLVVWAAAMWMDPAATVRLGWWRMSSPWPRAKARWKGGVLPRCS